VSRISWGVLPDPQNHDIPIHSTEMAQINICGSTLGLGVARAVCKYLAGTVSWFPFRIWTFNAQFLLVTVTSVGGRRSKPSGYNCTPREMGWGHSSPRPCCQQCLKCHGRTNAATGHDGRPHGKSMMPFETLGVKELRSFIIPQSNFTEHSIFRHSLAPIMTGSSFDDSTVHIG
jgi:hypothetical protein